MEFRKEQLPKVLWEERTSKYLSQYNVECKSEESYCYLTVINFFSVMVDQI